MDHTQAVLDTVNRFLSEIGVSPTVTVEVKFDPASSVYHVSLQSPEPALLIGYHGETLSALQLFVSIHLNQLLGEKITLSLNVNDYKERRQTSIESLADTAVAKVRATGQPHTLPPMTPAERRLVHLYLADSADVSTTSIGEGRDRSVIVSLKA